MASLRRFIVNRKVYMRTIIKRFLLGVGFCLAAIGIYRWSSYRYYWHNKGSKIARVGDTVTFCVDALTGTGMVVEVSNDCDDKIGAYTRYHVYVGVDGSGEPEIHSFPYRFIKRIHHHEVVRFTQEGIVAYKGGSLSQTEFLAQVDTTKWTRDERFVFICDENTPYRDLKNIRDHLSSKGIYQFSLSDGRAFFPVIFGCFDDMPYVQGRHQRFLMYVHRDNVEVSRAAIPLEDLNLEGDDYRARKARLDLASVPLSEIGTVRILDGLEQEKIFVGVQIIICDADLPCGQLLKILSAIYGKGYASVCIVSM